MREKYDMWTNSKQGDYNRTFGILSSLAIIMVVAGHTGYNILTVGDLFPYYSFHVPLFMFISGYFYRESEEECPLAYIKKKVLRLLLPYFLWNLFYGVVAWMLRSFGFSMGEGISLRTMFVAPFLNGYQYIYNYAAWFVPVLFVIEIMNLSARLILRRIISFVENKLAKPLTLWHRLMMTEWIMLAGGLLVGMVTVWLAIGGHVWGNYKAAGRILFLFPCFQMGCFYKQRLEVHDRLGNLPYFTIVLGIQLILNMCCNGLAFSAVWCTGFANGPVIPYVTVVSGIAFWLRVAGILTPAVGENGLVRYLGRNTYAVMMHHAAVFMLIKAVVAVIAAFTEFCADFDFVQFYSNIDYYYLLRGAEQFKMVYLAAGVALPLGIQYGLDLLWDKVGKRSVRFAIRR